MIAEAPAASRPITDEGAASGLFTFRPVEDEQGMLSFDRGDPIAVAGVALVGFFAVAAVGWLIVTDCDCPYEEMVYLHLLDRDLRVIESRELGGAYTAGIVEGIERLGAARFRLLFPSAAHAQLITVERRTTGGFRTSERWLHVTQES